MPERFRVVCTIQRAIQVLGFTFTFNGSRQKRTMLINAGNQQQKYKLTNATKVYHI